MKKTVYLVVNTDKSVRVVKRRPYAEAHEVVIPLVLTFPSGWGEPKWGTQAEIDVPEVIEVIPEVEVVA